MANIDNDLSGLEEMIATLDNIERGPKHTARKLDRVHNAAFRAVRTATHVETGRLRLSGRQSTHYDGTIWEGVIKFRRHPGIFELARGNKPSRNHPEGGHFFFNAVEPFLPEYEAVVNGAFEEMFLGQADI